MNSFGVGPMHLSRLQLTLIVRTLLSFSALQFSSGAMAQSPSDVFGLLGAIVQGAVAESLRTEWEAEPAAVITCLEAKGYGVSMLATHGIGPRDPRVRSLLRECRRPPSNDERSDAILSTDTRFAIDGLGLGEDVRPTSDVYRSFRCSRSEQFATFIWCRRTEAEQGKLGPYKKTTSILHSETTLKAAYVSRSIEPAFFGENDVDREIDRLSRIFRSQPHVMKAPAAAGMARGIIALWGSVVLEPLDAENVAAVASRKSIKKGLLVDFLGNFQRSAQEGLPIYRIGGGPGYVYSANHNEAGKGSLRLTVSDSRMYDPPGSGIPTATSPSAPSGDSALGGSRESENSQQSVQQPEHGNPAELEAARQAAAEAENRRQREAEAARRAADETERRHQTELEAARQAAAAVPPASQRPAKDDQSVTTLIIAAIVGLSIISGLLFHFSRLKQKIFSGSPSRAPLPEREHKWLDHKLAHGRDLLTPSEFDSSDPQVSQTAVRSHGVIPEGNNPTAGSSRLDHSLDPSIQQGHSMLEAYLDVMRNYAVLSGRVSRRDYWFFILALCLLAFVAAVLDSLFATATPKGGLFIGLVFLTHLLPQLAALVRRLHDIGWSGWWLLVLLTGVGGLFLIVLACLPGTEGPNRFGAAPVYSPQSNADDVSSMPAGPGSIDMRAAQKWLLVAFGLVILAAVVGGIITGGTSVGCDSPEVKQLLLQQAAPQLQALEAILSKQAPHERELAKAMLTRNSIQAPLQKFPASEDGEPYVRAISTGLTLGNRHSCSGQIIDKEGYPIPVNYTVSISDNGKEFVLALQRLGF